MFTRLVVATTLLSAAMPAQQVVTGQAAFADWSQEQPGVLRRITVADLPEPKPDESVQNRAHVIVRPSDLWPIAPPGFKVTLYAGGDAPPMQPKEVRKKMKHNKGTFVIPRLIRTARFTARFRSTPPPMAEQPGARA